MGFKSFTRSRAGLVTLLIVLVLIVGAVWYSMNFSGKNRLITGIDINIKPDTGVYFINTQDAINLVNKIAGNPTGKTLSGLNLTAVETAFKKLPFIASSQVFVSMDGKLKINLVQRIPVLRVYNAAGETYFLDSAGIKIPHHGHFAPDVLVASGNIQEMLLDSGKIRTPVLKDLLKVAVQIRYDNFWNAQFEQCYVDNFNELILVPRVGKHSIVIGSSENLTEKFENLRIFYEKGLCNIGWDKYKSIDLRYRGQVVGVKDVKETVQPKPKNVQKPQH